MDLGVSFTSIYVMKSDISSGAMPPPAPGAPTPAADASDVLAMGLDDLEAYLLALLQQGGLSDWLTERAPDGSIGLPSLVAVWLIAMVGEAVDEAKLVNLASVDSSDLMSVAGVARLVHDALDSLHPKRAPS